MLWQQRIWPLNVTCSLKSKVHFAFVWEGFSIKISEQSTTQRQFGKRALKEGGILLWIFFFGSQTTPFLLAWAKIGSVSWNHLLADQGLNPKMAARAIYEMLSFIFINVRATLSRLCNFRGSFHYKSIHT